MKQSEIVELAESMLSSKHCNKKTFIEMLQVEGPFQLSYKKYRFEDGPFKGTTFMSRAPSLKWLNRYNNLEVVFVDGPCKGIRTQSLICFDREIKEIKETIFTNILSI